MEIREPKAPHPMDAKPKAEPKPKAEAKPTSAAKSRATTKVAKPKPVPARKNSKGESLRCMVGTSTRQCSNPARHPHGKGAFTCTTHHRAIVAGAKVELRGLRTLVYVAPHAVAAAK